MDGKGDEFNLLKEQKFAKQHDVSLLSDNSILLFDNGNIDDVAKIQNFKLDEENKSVVKYKEYVLENIQSTAMGSVKAIDEEKNVYLICYGMGKFDKPVVEEINLETKEVMFSFDILLGAGMYNVNKK